MRLLLSQKNELFKIIEASEFLTPGQFSLTEHQIDGEVIPSIKLKNSDYYFSIFEVKNYVKSFFVNYVPGIDTYTEISSRIGWDAIIYHFHLWISNVSRELNEPNHWERLEYEISNVNFSTNFRNCLNFIFEFY